MASPYGQSFPTFLMPARNKVTERLKFGHLRQSWTFKNGKNRCYSKPHISLIMAPPRAFKKSFQITQVKYSLAKDMSPPKPSLLLLEMVELGELFLESPSPSDSPGSLKLLGLNGRDGLHTYTHVSTMSTRQTPSHAVGVSLLRTCFR